MTLEGLRSRAERRWREIVIERPDLGPAIALQRLLVNRLLEAAAQLTAADAFHPLTSINEIPDKLARGVPALGGERITLPTDVLGPLLPEFADQLAHGGAGEIGAHLRTALDEGRIDRGSLLAASLARDEPGIRSFAERLGLSPDLMWLVAELAAGPLAHALQQDLQKHERVRRALADWDKGYCPHCGSWPALGEIRGGAVHLRCSFCAADWGLAASGCCYCRGEGPAKAGPYGTGDERFVTETPDPSHADRHLQLCGSCGGYLKMIDVAEPAPFPLLSIEDLATTELDVLAVERGYGRPPLVEFERSSYVDCPAMSESDTVRLPPSRAERATASRAEAFGAGGKPDATVSARKDR